MVGSNGDIICILGLLRRKVLKTSVFTYVDILVVAVASVFVVLGWVPRQ